MQQTNLVQFPASGARFLSGVEPRLRALLAQGGLGAAASDLVMDDLKSRFLSVDFSLSFPVNVQDAVAPIMDVLGRRLGEIAFCLLIIMTRLEVELYAAGGLPQPNLPPGPGAGDPESSPAA